MFFTDLVLFWTINSEIAATIKYFMEQKIKFIGMIKCIKLTKYNKIKRTHGHYMQHSIEYCCVGVYDINKFEYRKINDIVFANCDNMLQSEKPNSMYAIIAQFCIQKGHGIELFGRANNLCENMITAGNEM